MIIELPYPDKDLMPNRKRTIWKQEYIDAISVAYKNAKYGDKINLQELADSIFMSKTSVSRKARELGLTDISREKKEIKSIRVAKFSSNDERAAYMSATIKDWHKNNVHPKGMAGKKHTKDSLEKISKASKGTWAAMTKDQQDNIILKSAKTKELNGTRQTMNRANASWGAAWREIGGYRKYYRSKWEANYARYLQWLLEKCEIKEWKHEPETFWFEGIKRGCLSYLPDFRVIENNGNVVYHEVKGWMDDRSKTKIKRMAKYHPRVKLIVIDAKGYAAVKKTMQPIILDWETDAKGR
jgi:DNA-binding transcriptional regulator GbsR (MarR family)